MTVRPINPEIEQEARMLAVDNRQASPDVTRIIWFPDDTEVRLVVLTELVPQYEGTDLHPFYFRSSPADNLPAPSAIIMIRPEESGKLKLPPEWGDWNDGIDL